MTDIFMAIGIIGVVLTLVFLVMDLVRRNERKM